MKTCHFPNKQTGIGVIEVLVASIVVAVGLLSVAKLQGNLIGDSRSNKTRAEAQALANSKLEELRDATIARITTGTNTGGFLPTAGGNDTVGGVLESYNRTWTVNTVTSPERKDVKVTVCWPSSSCSDQVIVQSVLTLDDVGNAAKNVKDAQTAASTAGGPSTNAESSDEITETKSVADGDTGTYVQDTQNPNKIWIRKDSRTTAIGAYTCSSVANLSDFENGLKTRRLDFDGVIGNEAIELYETTTQNSADYCIPRIRFNGGVIIPIRGIVHSGATAGNNQPLLDVNLFTFNASETGAFCVFNPPSNAKSAPYVCYVGGNCTGFTGTANDDDVTTCPSGSYAASKVGSGGWRGKVGLLGVAGTSNSYNNVCFAEELAGTPTTVDTARNYFALRNGINEGINKPYSCHDFLIINGKNTAAQVHSECVAQANAIGGFRLASKTIQRDITGNNVFDPTIDTSFCVGATATAYTITGNITGAFASPTIITVSDGTTTKTCPADSSTYTCSNFRTSANAVTISGVYNSQPVSCNLSLSSTTPSTTGCSLVFTVLPAYTITGFINAPTAAAANAVSLVVIDGSNSIPCTKGVYASGYEPYTCSISTASTAGVAINATAASGYSVSPATYAVPTLSGSTIVVPSPGNDFVASVVTTHTISGTISIGNNVTLTTVTAAVDTGAGTCTLTGTHAQNTTDSYSCTVPAGDNHLTIAISPACSTGGGSKKYELSDGTTTTLGTGSLVIPFTNIAGNISKNITITKSNTNC